MATKTLVPFAEYSHLSFDGPDRELLDGEITERSTPDPEHARAQQSFAEIFGPFRRSRGIEAGPELRLRLAPERVRIPDYCVFLSKQTESHPSSPPALAVEIVSPDDRHGDLVEKLEEFLTWGVENVWVVEPHGRRLSVYDRTGLRRVSHFDFAPLDLRIVPSDIFVD